MPGATSSRINMRINPDALATLRAAASAQQQDLTSFVLGASLERARRVLFEERVTRLSDEDALALESELDRDPRVVPELARLLKAVQDDRIGPISTSSDATQTTGRS